MAGEILTKQAQQVLLSQVLTVPQIIEEWGKSKKSIMMRIYKDDLIAEKRGGVWLVSRQSVVSLWGDPTITIEEN